MKKIALLAAGVAAVSATPAFAQATDSTSFDVTATVVDTCLIEDAGDVAFNEIVLEDSNIPGVDSLTLNNGSQQGSTQDVWVSCNYAAKITASSTNDGLFNAAGATLVANDPGDFTDKINYRIELTSPDGNFPFLRHRTNAGGNSTSVTAAGAFHDQASMRVYIDADDTSKRPVAGSYTDTATVEVGPV